MKVSYKFILILSAIILLMFGGLWYQSHLIKELNEENSAKKTQIESLAGRNIQARYTIAELKHSNDSLNKKIYNYIDSLNIKPKKVKEIVYLESKVNIIDTIRVNDTIFVTGYYLDTTVVKSAYTRLNLTLKYPNEISIGTEIKSEKTCIFYTKRETVNPPRKFFLFRWFQKKHTVTEVEVVEQNPEIQSGQTRFINISE